MIEEGNCGSDQYLLEVILPTMPEYSSFKTEKNSK